MKIAIIPARGGSQRIKNKNIREFHGKPIIAYSIELAINSGLFDRVIVSTDSPDIKDVAKRYGAEVLMRDAQYCHDRVGTQEVARIVLMGIGKEVLYASYAKAMSPWPPAACVIYATAPLATSADILLGWKLLSRELGRPYVFSVNQEPLFDAGQWYWGWAACFVSRQPLIGPDTRMFPIPPERVCDINTEEDWQRAEQMYAALHNKEAA